MFDTLGLIFTTLNSLSFGSVRVSYILAFFVGVPILAILFKKK